MPLQAISERKIQFTRQIYSIGWGVNRGKEKGKEKEKVRGEFERVIKTAQFPCLL